MKKAAQQDGLSEVAPAKALHSRLAALLGEGWESWEPETLWADLKGHSIALSAALKDKIQAIRTLLTTNAYWGDHVAFEKVTMGLNGLQASFDSYQHPSPAMIARGLLEASSVRSHGFSDEVLRYIAVICFGDGLVLLPGPLAVAQESLDALSAPVVGGNLKDEVSRLWEARAVNGDSEGMYTETVTGIQLARMAAILEYAEAS
jgi:hypothetical protein